MVPAQIYVSRVLYEALQPFSWLLLSFVSKMHLFIFNKLHKWMRLWPAGPICRCRECSWSHRMIRIHLFSGWMKRLLIASDWLDLQPEEPHRGRVSSSQTLTMHPFPFFFFFLFLSFLSSASTSDPSDPLPLPAVRSHPGVTDSVYQDTTGRLRFKNSTTSCWVFIKLPVQKL